MAKQIVETLIDDTDGSEASDTVRFAIDGAAYEIDLSDAHTKEIRSALEPFIAVARRVSNAPSRPGRRPRTTPVSGEKASLVRAWAKEHDIKVSTRGRIPASVIEQYDATH